MSFFVLVIFVYFTDHKRESEGAETNLGDPVTTCVDLPVLPPADELVNFYPKRFTNQSRSKRNKNNNSSSNPGTEPTSSTNNTSSGSEHQRPAYSYVMMIAMAIKASPQKRLPLRKIYEFITQNFPHFKPDVGGWKNSVRHNLSLNDCFVKQPRQPGEGKGHNWIISK